MSYTVEYGRGAKSVGEQIGKTKEEAQEIIDSFFKSFPKVKIWIDDSTKKVHELGYVEDVAGRRRRLPDAQLPKYQIKFTDPNKELNGSFNPFIGCKDRVDHTTNNLLKSYKDKLDKIRYAKEYEKIQADALKDGIEIHSNIGFIAQAERQAVNSQIQGSAASLTKAALIEIHKDPVLKDLGAYLINTVHDEILIEAPEAVADQAGERLCHIMKTSALKFVDDVPMSVDYYNVPCWYCDEFFVTVEAEFKSLLADNIDPMEAFELECSERLESTRSQIYEIVKGYLPEIPADIDVNYKSL